MSSNPEHDLGAIARTLSEISHTLDSGADADERTARVLKLIGGIVPYRRCSMLKTHGVPGSRDLFLEPASAPEEEARVRAELQRILHLVVDGEEASGLPARLPQLTLPLMGLDEVNGLLRVEPPEGVSYGAEHLRLLSVVVAQLGAYLTMTRLRAGEERRTQELTSSNEFQQMLVGIVSHDLRNPLTVVTAAATLLQHGADGAVRSKAVDRVLRSAEKATRIINDLLDLTHVRVTGQMSLHRTRLDLAGLVADVVEDARLSHPGREIRFGTAATSIAGDWDPDRLSQLLSNLLNNATQYGERGAPIDVTLDVRGDDVALAVHNEGPPIAAELLPNIFDPFRRGRRQEPRGIGGGLGLGLYIVDQISRAHGGSVGVQSAAGAGTTFTVVLPRLTRTGVQPSPPRNEP